MIQNTGTILRVSGTIIDVEFPRESAPAIYNLLTVALPKNGSLHEHDGADTSKERIAHFEVAQQLGDGVVRCIALDNTFGIQRGLTVIDTQAPIKVPVGPQTLGRVFDV